MNDLHTELLCGIFEHVGTAESEDVHEVLAREPVAFALTLVSRVWYDAALATPCLWTTITSNLADATLELFLIRAKNLPIRLFLRIAAEQAFHIARFRAILRRCLLRPLSLSIMTDAPTHVLAALEHLHPQNLSTLNVYTLTDNGSPSFLGNARMTFPITRAYFSSGFVTFPRYLESTRMTELEVGPQAGLEMHASVFANLGSCVRSVRSSLSTLRLDIRGNNEELGVGDVDQIVLPRLQNLYLNGPTSGALRALIEGFQCPNLLRYGLSIHQPPEWPAVPPEWPAMIHYLHESARFLFQAPQSLFIHINPTTNSLLLLALPTCFDWARFTDDSLDSLMRQSRFSVEACFPDFLDTIDGALRALICMSSGTPREVEEVHLHVENMDTDSIMTFALTVHSLLRPRKLTLCCPPAVFRGYVSMWCGAEASSRENLDSRHTAEHIWGFYSAAETAQEIKRMEQATMLLSSSSNVRVVRDAAGSAREAASNLPATDNARLPGSGFSASLEGRGVSSQSSSTSPSSLHAERDNSSPKRFPLVDLERKRSKPGIKMPPAPIIEYYDVNSKVTKRIRRAVADMDTRIALWGRRREENRPS